MLMMRAQLMQSRPAAADKTGIAMMNATIPKIRSALFIVLTPLQIITKAHILYEPPLCLKLQPLIGVQLIICNGASMMISGLKIKEFIMHAEMR